MFDKSRKDTINTLLENAANCGANDLILFALKEDADKHLESDRALTECIEKNNKTGFDLLINHNSVVTHNCFTPVALYREKYSGVDMDAETQRYMLSTLLTKSKPQAFNPKSRRSYNCIDTIIETGRDDMYRILSEQMDICKLVKPDDLVSFLGSLSTHINDYQKTGQLLGEFIDKYRPLQFKDVEHRTAIESENALIKKLFEYGMNDYLETMHTSGEIDMYRKQILDKIESVESFIDSLTGNPNLRISEYGLKKIVGETDLDTLTPEQIKILLLHTEEKGIHYSLQIKDVIETLAKQSKTDLIIALLDAACEHSEHLESGIYTSVQEAYQMIKDGDKAIAFLDAVLRKQPYQNIFEDTPENEGFDIAYRRANFLFAIHQHPVKFNKLLSTLTICPRTLRRFTDHFSRSRFDKEETFLSVINNKPYLISAILNSDGISDETKADFITHIKTYHYAYAERTIESATKMLLKPGKRTDKLKGELAARIILASDDSIREALTSFYNNEEAVTKILTLRNVAPMDALQNFNLSTTVKSTMLSKVA